MAEILSPCWGKLDLCLFSKPLLRIISLISIASQQQQLWTVKGLIHGDVSTHANTRVHPVVAISAGTFQTEKQGQFGESGRTPHN